MTWAFCLIWNDPKECYYDLDILSEMKKVNHSILANFLELLDTLVDADLQNEVRVSF